MVLCTGFSDIIDEERAERMGIDGYLPKPVIKRHLARILYDVLRKNGATVSEQ